MPGAKFFGHDFIPSKNANEKDSPQTRSLFIEKLYEGATLSSLCKQSTFPSASTIAVWRRKYPEFDELVEDAEIQGQKMRFGKAIDLAEKVANGELPPKLAQTYTDINVKVSEKLHKRQFGKEKDAAIDNSVTNQTLVLKPVASENKHDKAIEYDK